MRPPYLPSLAAVATLLVVSAGCGSGGSDLMPLTVGKSWNYTVRSVRGLYTYVSPITVSREISVASTRGVELKSTLGPSRMAWSNDTLLVERLAGTQFIPPLPLLYRADETHDRHWRGQVVFVDRDSPATAVQSQSPDDELVYGGKRIHCIRSTIKLQTAIHEIELETWFSAGLGIVQQEQRTDGILLVKLQQIAQKASSE